MRYLDANQLQPPLPPARAGLNLPRSRLAVNRNNPEIVRDPNKDPRRGLPKYQDVDDQCARDAEQRCRTDREASRRGPGVQQPGISPNRTDAICSLLWWALENYP